MYFFRTFKKSTAPYKVHNMVLRYIKYGGRSPKFNVHWDLNTRALLVSKDKRHLFDTPALHISIITLRLLACLGEGAGECGELWGGGVLEPLLPPLEDDHPEAEDHRIGSGTDDDRFAEPAPLRSIPGLKHRRKNKIKKCFATGRQTGKYTVAVIVLLLLKVYCKKRLAVFPSPTGMSLTNLSLAGINFIIPGHGELGQ